MVTVGVYAQSNYPFNGLDMNMGNLSRPVSYTHLTLPTKLEV